MNDRIEQLERDKAELVLALRRLTEVFQEETPGRYSIAVEFDGGDGIVCIIAEVTYDDCGVIKDAEATLLQCESDGDEA